VPYGHETIAEGVEDAVTLTLLGDFGVDFAQGSHLGRPSLVAHTD
jgi:EAL domain-containing protein (putative c-di-GMP-specific phosphodiesterase class I)